MMLTHRDVMVDLAQRHRWRLGVELGLGKGYLFERFLTDCPALHMIGVDMFRRAERKARVVQIAAKFPDRSTVHGCLTVDAAVYVPDGSVDFVFIDAGHSYKAVSADIQAWRAKVKPGGWFGGHDHEPRFAGVCEAVREAYGSAIDILPHAIWHARIA